MEIESIGLNMYHIYEALSIMDVSSIENDPKLGLIYEEGSKSR